MSKRISQQQLESYLWGAATLLRGTIDAGDYKQFIFPLLFFKRLCDVFDEETKLALNESGGDAEFAAYPENHRFQVPQQAHWFEVRQTSNNVGKALQSAMRAIEKANPDKLYGIFGDAQWTNKDRLPDAMLRDLIEHFSCLELTVANLPEDELGQGYEYLIKKFADDSGHTAAEFYTNRTVVHLMTEMLEPQSGESIYDPTCGSGGMLLSCIMHLRRKKKEWRNVRLYGQERNLMTSSIARMNCFLHGIEDFQIVRGDTLSEPKLVEGDRLMRFDVVLANPPYSIKQWDREAFASDPWGRNLYGTPPQGRADYAFWQHILQSLQPNTGRCAILFPHGVLFRDAEKDMREKVINADVIEAVVGLGSNLFYNSSMPSCVVICRTKKPRVRKGKILLINAVDEVVREQSQSFLSPDHIHRVEEAYKSFRNEAHFSRVVTLEEIRSNGFSLNIPLYVSPHSTNPTIESSESESVSEALEKWLESGMAVRDALATLVGKRLPANGGRSLRPVGLRDLLKRRSGWKSVRLADLLTKTEETERNPLGAGFERFLMVDHFDADSLQIRRWGSIADGNIPPTFYKVFRNGQILYPTRNPHLRRAALAEFDGICGEKTLTLTPRNGVDPRFLPFIFQSEGFIAFSTNHKVGSTNPHVRWRDIGDFEFSLPPLGLQHSLSEILGAADKAICETNSLLQELYSSLGTLVSSLTDAKAFNKWKNGRLIDCVDVVSGQVDPSQEPFRSMILVGPNHIEEGTGRIVSTETARAQNAISGKYLFEPGDVVYSKIRPNLRKCFIARFSGLCSADMYALRPKKNLTMARYLMALLLSEHFTSFAVSRCVRTGIPKINRAELSEYLIPIPSIKDQESICQEMELIDQGIACAREHNGDLQQVKFAVLNAIVGEPE